MHYQTYAEYVKRLGELTGFEDRLTTYCFRQGTANAIDGVCLSPLLTFKLISRLRCCSRCRPGSGHKT
jgi:hypothetical protein